MVPKDDPGMGRRPAAGNLQANFGFMITPRLCVSRVKKGPPLATPKTTARESGAVTAKQ